MSRKVPRFVPDDTEVGLRKRAPMKSAGLVSVAAAALVATIAGVGGTLPVVLAAAQAVGATPDQVTGYFSAIDAEVAAYAALKATTKGSAAFTAALATLKAADAATRTAAAALPKGALRALDHIGWDFD